jgi:hypothetical protein
MQILHKRNLLPNLKQIDLDFYEHCVYGKQKRVRFLRVGKEKKSERLDIFHTDVWGPAQKWKSLVENETQKRLKCLRSDNGGEYCSKDFDDYFSYHGICREKTVLGTPQENGVSKRMNMKIMEHARSMRLRVGFPLQF